MSILGASFQIGRSALATYQSALAVTGQNIANVGNPDYARQSGRLATLDGGLTPSGHQVGAGVRMTGLVRNFDAAVENRLRVALGARSGAETSQQAWLQTESLYNELTDADLSTQLNNFFNAFATLEINPQDASTRSLIRSSAENVAGEFQRLHKGLVSQVEDLNVRVGQAVDRADDIAGEIANLNKLIITEESRGVGVASALRDRRDGLLRELSEYLDIQVRETANGAVNVYVNSDPLIEAGRSRGLKTELRLEDGLEIFQVRFTDNNGLVRARDGLIAGVVDARDNAIRGQISALDGVARAFIGEVNRVQSTGVGLNAQQSLSGVHAVRDANAVLNDPTLGLPYPVSNGVMIVHVRNAQTGQETTRQIEVDLDGLNGDDTTLADLAAALDGVPGLSAGVTTDLRLQVTADAGSEVWFSEDTSGALTALGVGAFFEGDSASTINLHDSIRNNVSLIAASANGAAADGANAGRFALLQRDGTALLNGRTVQQAQADMFSTVAVGAANAQVRYDAADAVYSSMLAQREAVSGVSLDEEAINLSKFQTAFQGAARYLSAIDRLADDVLALVS